MVYGNGTVAGGSTYGVWEDLKTETRRKISFMIPNTQRYSLIEDFHLIVEAFSGSNRDLEDFSGPLVFLVFFVTIP